MQSCNEGMAMSTTFVGCELTQTAGVEDGDLVVRMSLRLVIAYMHCPPLIHTQLCSLQTRVPEKFALKELISPKPFPLGGTENIRDYLPLNEAAIQRYMRHSSIVDTYWADVRCLHPDTNQPLNLGVSDLEGAWTPLDNLSDVERTYTEAAEQQRPAMNSLPFKSIKLQMRIAMEHCDLGAQPYACMY